MVDLSQYSYVVAYGIGQYYDFVKTRVNMKLDYLCDKNWENIGPLKDGIKVISPEQLQDLSNVFVVIFSGNPRNYQSITAMLDKMKLPYAHISKVCMLNYSITGKELKQTQSPYIDALNNRIEFSEDIEDAITISFTGGNNLIQIAEKVSVGSLKINCGNNAKLSIGAGTIIEEITCFATDGSIIIGKECLFSVDIILRNSDSHHIFDKTTGKRINYAGDIHIGNHVWIGEGARLLGNFSIGDNSVVGTRAVSSSQFLKEVIIAGCPAKVTREGICWSKDFTNYYNHDYFEECLEKDAKTYF